jgi:hypothetical protein
MRRNLGWHAYTFVMDSKKSSYPLLEPILAKVNIDLFYLDNQLSESYRSTTPLCFTTSYRLALFCRDKIVAGADVNESLGMPGK